MANEPVIGSIAISGVKVDPDVNGNPIPCRIVVDDTFTPPRILIEVPDRALRDLGKVDIANVDNALPAGQLGVTAFANVAASQTDALLVTAVAGKKIRVLQALFMAAATATNLTFNTKPGGAGTAISPLFACGANGGASVPFSPIGWFDTNTGEGLTVTTGAGSTTGVLVRYTEV